MGCSGCTCNGIRFNEDNTVRRITENGHKLPANNWLQDYEQLDIEKDLCEVRFKSTRKGFFIKDQDLSLKSGDIVAVEALYGHDIGTVTLTGKLAWLQMRKKKSDQGFGNLWKIYRRATANDLKQYREAIKLEKPVLISARKIIKKLGLEMKLGDVEYQGDKKKAIFYYIADDRVDFRELIKLLAAEFGIRVEMKQIGARQEAGRIGGIGSCGRELCCSSWKTDLHSVSLNVAKIQDLPANAQKLAGQCGKLKCCLMYELDTYLEAREEIPNTLLELETEKGTAYHRRTDLLNRIMYYSYDDALAEDLIPVPVEKVKEVINLNKRGIRVELTAYISTVKRPEESIRYFTEAESITRFDSMHKNKKKNRGRKRL